MWDKIKSLFTKKDATTISDEAYFEILTDLVNRVSNTDLKSNLNSYLSTVKKLGTNSVNKEDIYDIILRNTSLSASGLSAIESIIADEFAVMSDRQKESAVDRPLPNYGVKYDALLEKYFIEPKFKIEVLSVIEKLFLQDTHLGTATQYLMAMLPTKYTLRVNKFSNIDDSKREKIDNFLQLMPIGNDNETNTQAICSMCLQLVLAGAISREISLERVNGKLRVVGSVPINNKNIYVTFNPNTFKNEFLLILSNTERHLSVGGVPYIYSDKKNAFDKGEHSTVFNPAYTFTKLPQLLNYVSGINVMADNGLYLYPLTPMRYIYSPLITLNENPIGIPPYIHALNSIKMEEILIGGVYSFIDVFSTVAFVSMLMKPPQRMDGESDVDAKKRSNAILDVAYKKIANGFKNGIYVGWEGVHNLEVIPTVPTSGGFENIYKIVLTNKASGLGMPPFVLGVDTNISDSLAKVVLQILVSKLTDYTNRIADAIAKIAQLGVLLEFGEKLDFTVEFESSLVADTLREQQVEGLRIDNILKKVTQGLISNEDAAKELGYEHTYLEESPAITLERQSLIMPNATMAKKPSSAVKNDKPRPSQSKATGTQFTVADPDFNELFAYLTQKKSPH